MTIRVKPQRKFRKIAEPNSDLDSKDPQRIIGEEVADIIGDIDVITSEDHLGSGDHYPAIDVDVPVYTVPSNGPHKYALFIDKAVPEEAYFDLIDAMARAGIVETGYAEVSRKRKYTAVRPPWVDKPAKAYKKAQPPQEPEPF